MFKRIRSERGFTLVELLVVLAILAILIAIVVPNLAGLTGGAQETACDQELNTVQMAMDVVMTDNSAVSVTEDLVADNLDDDDDVEYQDWEGTNHTATMLLRGPTAGTYTWTADGSVFQAVCP